jgi:hypothetical protein
MADGDAREGKWRGNWRMEWAASTLHTSSEHGVSSITTANAHTSSVSIRQNWRPRRLNGPVCFAERRNLFSARVPSYFKRSIRVSDAGGISCVHWLKHAGSRCVSEWSRCLNLTLCTACLVLMTVIFWRHAPVNTKKNCQEPIFDVWGENINLTFHVARGNIWYDAFSISLCTPRRCMGEYSHSSNHF